MIRTRPGADVPGDRTPPRRILDADVPAGAAVGLLVTGATAVRR